MPAPVGQEGVVDPVLFPLFEFAVLLLDPPQYASQLTLFETQPLPAEQLQSFFPALHTLLEVLESEVTAGWPLSEPRSVPVKT